MAEPQADRPRCELCKQRKVKCGRFSVCLNCMVLSLSHPNGL